MKHLNSPSPVRGRKSCGGATLIELMTAVGIGSISLAAISTVLWYLFRSFVAMGNYADLDKASRTALDKMTRDIRQASYLVSSATNQLVFSMGGTNNLTFAWDPSTRQLTRARTGEPTTTLLKECDYLLFNTYQRNMSNQVFSAFSNASPVTCKLVDVSWMCSRQILAQKVNTESVQTAKIVIRNEHPH